MTKYLNMVAQYLKDNDLVSQYNDLVTQNNDRISQNSDSVSTL